MSIAADKVVSIEYTLTDDDGEVLDTSVGDEPLIYLHGAENIVDGLERALEGKNPGDELTVVVEPEDGYGEYLAELVQTVDRDAFEGVDELEVGMEFEAEAPDGESQIVVVRDVDGDAVTIDANHPLAGLRLTFQVKVIDIRDATEDELAHGHPHGDDDHEH
ncbi:FKBP-type peptidyl-prolyl cis-trans isomerase [Nocardia seriolae]|uniref:Peptidyl-prolyl cis-trans isomerase n=2 Tax=Nocardia seriolae TaxID=37332 RepID=A0A0B8N8V9_9NOCA|nr:peptidylprolyl isomerase [Nocardia seriolae]APB00170.1 Peptidylprolyl isomerase [Nocardia seriolae]MTJ64845.1 peptidylprolyl isomerase [Nocardia seriolae]MTJ72377.1 peptidylprolyl isomerase [Nocardia seriolae]MTJ89679.1 peptidylprolyl isomerase [Nocardia seriolae]MTK33654.1 peptidylprolyl isomerase [Nocardia seriolae]